ncbi:MAG TPA: class I SAM-dependent methyltransferase [Acidimicrobiales bacterium]|nr:class I SAM-dependent methyltransferase [Acidimicrobiales bacterium]
MFDKSARYYDLIYAEAVGIDYAAAADSIAARLPDARSLLDVACGTGLHLAHLRDRFECAGIDLDPTMVAIARDRCPGLAIEVADMTGFDLGRTFDAVICMFSSIGYARTEARLRQAVAAMVDHLNPGGTLLVEPWLQREVIVEGRISAVHAEAPGLQVTRMSRITVEGDISTIEFRYLVGTAEGIEHLAERHEVGLFTWDQYRDAFEAAGLATTIDEPSETRPRGLLTGRRTAPRALRTAGR